MSILGLTYEEEIRLPVAYVCFTGGYLFGSVEPDKDGRILLGTARSHSVLNAEFEKNGCEEYPSLSKVKIVQSWEKSLFFAILFVNFLSQGFAVKKHSGKAITMIF